MICMSLLGCVSFSLHSHAPSLAKVEVNKFRSRTPYLSKHLVKSVLVTMSGVPESFFDMLLLSHTSDSTHKTVSSQS